MANNLKLKWIKIPEKFPKVKIDEEFLQNVESLAEKCFENSRYQEVYRLHNTWYNHVSNILGYIADFCSKSDLKLSKDEWTIIFASAILHDIGKSLPCGHPLIDDKKIFDDDFVLKNLEDAHHVISFIVLRHFYDEDFRKIVSRRPIIITTNGNKKTISETKFSKIEGFEYFTELNDMRKQYLKCVAWISLRHKKITDKLLYVFKSYLPSKPGNIGSKEEIEKRQLAFLESEVKDNDNIKQINDWLNKKRNMPRNGDDPPDRFSVLSALLQLGDKLDITKDRIREDRLCLEVLLDDLVEKEFLQQINIQKQNQIGPQSLARWFQYYYVDKVEIKKKSDNDKAGIDITIHYTYPECIGDDFLFIRSQLEKDFEDLGILSTLENALQKIKRDEDYRVSIYRSENRKDSREKGGDEKLQRIIGLQRRGERLVYCLEKVCKSVDPNSNDGKYIKKKLQGCLELTKARADAILLCIEGEGKKKLTPKICALFKRIEEIFRKNDEKASHPDWEKYSIKLQENIRCLLCREERNGVTGKIKDYWKIITNKDDKYEVMLSLSTQARIGLEEWKEEAAKKNKKDSQSKLFYPPDSKTRFIPVNLDVAILLNLFRHLRDESLTVEDISNISGLDRGRILKYCGWLEHEQYLLLDDKKETYKINLDPAKYSIVEKVLKDFDSRRSEMVSKIRDIDRFGKPLALYSELNNERITTNIKGFDQILCPFEEEKMWGLPLRKSILLVGPPGSGKTTLALDIIRQVRLQRLPEEIALYLTFSGDIQRLADDFKPLGWEYHDIAACVRSLSTLQGKTYLNDPDKFFKHLLNILDEFSPDLVAIDNLGYFLRLVPPEFCREIFNRLIKVLTVRGITSILIGDDIPNGIGFESFDSDGVICLHYKDGKRELEITKMRGREFAGGKHPFKIKNLSEKLKNLSEEDKRKLEKRDKPIIEIFPNIQMHLEVAQRNKGKKGNDKIGDPLNSGINGLDELLPIYSEKENKKYGFEQGEIILVLGSPGAGKTVSGLHFLAEGYNMGGKKDKKQETVLWVSFESDLDGIYLATRSFSKEAKVKQFYEKMNENKDEMFRFFPPAQLNPDELVNFLLDACKGEEECIVEDNENKKTEPKKLRRLVLDSVNDIEQAFPTDMAFRSFMTSLVQLLREKRVTVMFLYRTRNFFGKAEDIGRTLASVVDTIICLKVLEIQNAVQKGLFLLKVRGREHRSKLLAINFKDDEGMSVLDSGWTMSGLISGEAGEIKEPRVSVKLFFENRNEFLINALIVNEYNRRFKGGHTNFVHVRKPQIYSEFWSFKGSSGAGHSNVRVLSLCDYWAVHFQREDKLYDLFEYVSATTYQLVHRDEFWRRCAVYSFKKNAFEIFSIPNYVDVGVLAFHKKLKGLSDFWDAVKPSADNNWDTLDTRERLAQLTWNDLDPIKNPKIMKAIEKINGNKYSPLRYLFTMPSLESKASFVSFFLELYWSFGGVIFDLRKLFFEYARECSNSLLKRKAEDAIKVEEILFFKTQAIELKGKMAFIAEILMLIPERILNNAIRSMNAAVPNFIGDICRHGEVALEKFLREKAVSQGEKTFLSQIEKRSGISNIDEPLKAFLELPYIKEVKNAKKNPAIIFITKLISELKNDAIWNKKDQVFTKQDATLKHLIIALKDTKESVSDVMSGGNEKNDEKKFVLIILYFVVSRIITNRERYQKLLEWRYKGKKTKEDREHLVERIQIGHKNSAAEETLKFLFQLVNNGIAPNPHYGNFNDQTYLARKWSGDVSPRPKLPESKDIFGPLDLNMPPDAYEYKQNEKEKTNYQIAPLPSYEQNKKRSSCAVMGLWSLGITKPALSPEIGWIFIDALTEDRFIRLRARKGLGLPAKVSAYQRESLQKDQPDIYGSQDADGKEIKGIVQYYDLATQDKAKKEEKSIGDAPQDIVHRRTRERASIPYYYQIEEFLIKELSRFFEPSFFAILKGKEGNDEEKKKEERPKLIEEVLKRIHNRIKNFLISEFKLVDEKKGQAEK